MVNLINEWWMDKWGVKFFVGNIESDFQQPLVNGTTGRKLHGSRTKDHPNAGETQRLSLSLSFSFSLSLLPFFFSQEFRESNPAQIAKNLRDSEWWIRLHRDILLYYLVIIACKFEITGSSFHYHREWIHGWREIGNNEHLGRDGFVTDFVRNSYLLSLPFSSFLFRTF